MSNGESILPPDIRETMAKQNPPPPATSVGGIGGRAPENSTTAHQRNVGMGVKEDAAEAVAEAAPEEEVVPTTCTNGMCNAKTKAEWAYCAKCGTDQVRGGAGKNIGVTLTEEDIQDYLFKGYVVRDLKILGKHTMTLRSSQAKDLKQIDDYIINGAWQKDEKGEERQVSDFMIRQMNAMCITAMAVQKIDGSSIGNDLNERVAWLEERGSAFVDMIAGRVTLFNRAITEYLRKEDSLLGS
jgi:hypothetical protein